MSELNNKEIEELKGEFENIRKQAQEAANEVKELHDHLPEIIKNLSQPGINFDYDPTTGKISVNFDEMNSADSVIIHSEKGLMGLINNSEYIKMNESLNFILTNRKREVNFDIKPLEDVNNSNDFDGLEMVLDNDKVIRYPAPFKYQVMQGIVNKRMYIFDFVQPYPTFAEVNKEENYKLVALKLKNLIIPFQIFPESPLSKPEALDGLQSIGWRILSGEFGSTVEEVSEFINKNMTFDQEIDNRPVSIETFVDDIFSINHESPFIPGLVYAEIIGPHMINIISLDGGSLLGYFESAKKKNVEINLINITESNKKLFIDNKGNSKKIFVINPSKFNLISKYL